MGSLRKDSNGTWGSRRDSIGGSVTSLKKDHLQVPISPLRRNSKMLSNDSLDGIRRNSWDPGRRGSSGSSGGYEDGTWEGGRKVPTDL